MIVLSRSSVPWYMSYLASATGNPCWTLFLEVECVLSLTINSLLMFFKFPVSSLCYPLTISHLTWLLSPALLALHLYHSICWSGYSARFCSRRWDWFAKESIFSKEQDQWVVNWLRMKWPIWRIHITKMPIQIQQVSKFHQLHKALVSFKKLHCARCFEANKRTISGQVISETVAFIQIST